MNKHLKPILFITGLVFFLSCSSNNRGENTLQVKISKNIETLFILYPIVDIGMPPANNSLCKIASNEFKKYKNHEVVRLLDTIISQTGIDRPVNLILHYSELPNISQIYPIDNNILKSISGNGDIKKGQKIADDFVLQLADFYKKANVELFFNNYKTYYEKALKDVQKHLPPENFISTMEHYYGQENTAYILNPSPVLYPGFGFGSRIETETGLLIFNTFGAQNEIDNSNSKILFDFDNYAEIRDLSVHEFGHSFINPITELPENVKIINQYSYLFKPIEKDMSEQAYRNWWICVTEHLVRLGEIRIATAMNDSLTADKIRTGNIEQNKFIYLPYLEEKIIEYESKRDKYPSFSVFFPELIATFSQIDTTEINF